MSKRTIKEAVADERERCMQIARKVADKYTRLWKIARTDPELIRNRSYYDGASGAAEEIVAKLEAHRE